MTERPSAENGALAHALTVVLARVRCALIHDQQNDGRCVSCILWAENVLPPDVEPERVRESGSHC